MRPPVIAPLFVDDFVKILGALTVFLGAVAALAGVAVKVMPKREPKPIPPTPVEQSAAEVQVLRDVLAEVRADAESLRGEVRSLRAELEETRGLLRDMTDRAEHLEDQLRQAETR